MADYQFNFFGTECKTEKTKKCSVCREIKPVSCFNWNVKVYRSSCKPCERAQNKKIRDANPEIHRERNRKRFAENPQAVRDYQKQWYHAHAESERLVRKEHYYNNPQPYIDRAIAYNKENPHLQTARKAKYRTSQLHAVPLWANLNKIKEIYKECKRISKETGISHAVDHVVPLQSKVVCGLHVENNLKIITTDENRRKASKFTPE